MRFSTTPHPVHERASWTSRACRGCGPSSTSCSSTRGDQGVRGGSQDGRRLRREIELVTRSLGLEQPALEDREVGSGAGRDAALARGGLPAPALRTGRASSPHPALHRTFAVRFRSRSGNGGPRPIGGSALCGGRPRRGDSVPAISVAGHRHPAGPVEPRAFGAPPVAPPVAPLDLSPGQPRVLLARPQHDSPR